MEITPTLGIAIMMNNYFHDVATALLAASAFVLYAVYRVEESCTGPGATEFFLKTYRRMVRLARFALAWIVLGGIPRTIFYTRFEWANAAGKGQVPALIVKHILMVILVAGGVWGWRKLQRKVARCSSAS
ncbi:hypothetical protein [Geobacter pickeringii]|uniref:Uncharacterized protein n=1 Tax=Geobacter pickeringii TaxID=345632 RepID=A0A0B5BDV7_9BACT|nr:hypothetical protein [Geobacter pickeringii]AJE04657.1 hypothetical protein GPICK_15915 [Geobacter pickeringii]